MCNISTRVFSINVFIFVKCCATFVSFLITHDWLHIRGLRGNAFVSSLITHGWVHKRGLRGNTWLYICSNRMHNRGKSDKRGHVISSNTRILFVFQDVLNNTYWKIYPSSRQDNEPASIVTNKENVPKRWGSFQTPIAMLHFREWVRHYKVMAQYMSCQCLM